MPSSAHGNPSYIKLGIVNPKTQKVEKIVKLSLEEYIAGVLTREIPGDWPEELKKAQAVLIRTYALKNMKRHAKGGYNLCNLTHCQAWQDYKLGTKKEEIRSLVKATKGQVLMYKGKLVQPFYHSTCGGYTALAEDVFMQESLPYLRAGFDGFQGKPNCVDSPHYKWKSFLKEAEVFKIAEKILKRKVNFYDIEIHTRGKMKKRAKRMCFVGAEGDLFSNAYDFWMAAGQMFGWNIIKSTYFSVSQNRYGYDFTGHGNGHGLGMCQWGAMKLAKMGYDYKKILRFYFTKVKIVRM